MIYIIISILLILLLTSSMLYDHIKFKLYLKELLEDTIEVEYSLNKIKKAIKEEKEKG